MNYGTCMTHCNFGEEWGHCKYGHEDCPAMHPNSLQSKVLVALRAIWHKEFSEEKTELSFYDWMEESNIADKMWRAMLDRIYKELDNERMG